jgi:hypothetical protein
MCIIMLCVSSWETLKIHGWVISYLGSKILFPSFFFLIVFPSSLWACGVIAFHYLSKVSRKYYIACTLEVCHYTTYTWNELMLSQYHTLTLYSSLAYFYIPPFVDQNFIFFSFFAHDHVLWKIVRNSFKILKGRDEKLWEVMLKWAHTLKMNYKFLNHSN